MIESSELPCLACLRRMWLIERLAGHIQCQRSLVETILGLSDRSMISLLAGAEEEQIMLEHGRFDHRDARALIEAAAEVQVELLCRHDVRYPRGLDDLHALQPSVLAVAGGAESFIEASRGQVVAVVGTRRATRYGLDAAATMGRELAAAGVTVISGLAFGIDSAAHEGALRAGGRTVAVLAGPPHTAYPVARTGLYREIRASGGVVSELGPRMRTWAWALRARNRLIAAMASITVVIEAPRRSGSLITAWHADQCDRWIGVLPGPVGSRQSVGTNALLAKHTVQNDRVRGDRVRAVRHAQDVLDILFGEGAVQVPAQIRPVLSAAEQALLDQISAVPTNLAALDADRLVLVSSLELKGWVARGPGGSLTAIGPGRSDG
jgi:DNA processing protein